MTQTNTDALTAQCMRSEGGKSSPGAIATPSDGVDTGRDRGASNIPAILSSRIVGQVNESFVRAKHSEVLGIEN